jgi:hypothetical protein
MKPLNTGWVHLIILSEVREAKNLEPRGHHDHCSNYFRAFAAPC